MSAAPLLAILATFKTALSGPLSSQPHWREAALPAPNDELPSIALQLGDESEQDQSHNVLTWVRRARLSVIVADDSQSGAEQCAWEVQEAASYTVGIGAVWSGCERAEHADGERHYFTIRVNFDVSFEAAVPLA